MKGLVAAGALVAVALAAAPAPAQDAGSDAARLKAMLECDAIKTESVRLSCYDQAARRSRAAMGGGRSGMLPGLPAGQAASPRAEFGMNPKVEKALPNRPKGPAPITEINARVASARDTGIGRWQIAFLDGTRWQMLEQMTGFRPPRKGEEVRVRKAALGGYLMYVGNQPSFRVERVR